MITMHVVGGLGNQLFIYNRGRSLVKQGYNVNLFNYCTQYPCFLNKFNITLPFTSKPEGRWIAERSLRFDSNPEVEDPAILAGYYQCESYFKGIEKDLRSEITLKEEPNATVQQYAEQIGTATNSVMVHVRHGDYLTWAYTRHGVLPMDYYVQASKYFTSPHFFLFSDDPTCMIPLPYTRISCAPYEDLYLMSKCKHAIIANSSLSWHGAWLGPDKKGTVVAPRQWFAKGNEDAQDIVPSRWIKI